MTTADWIAVAVGLVLLACLIWLGHVSGAWKAKQGDE